MKLWRVGLLVLASVAAGARAQTANEIKSGAPQSRPGETDDQKAVRLLAEMVTALGGDAWLHKTTETIEGQRAAFFHGQPTGAVIRFIEYRRFATATASATERVNFLTPRSQLIAEGYHSDLMHLWTADHGYEYTYKGRSPLPPEQVADYLRRRRHSLEEMMRTWVKAPGVIIVYEGLSTRDRHAVDKVTVLSANNDAVTVELDQNTHLPLERSFEWRNVQFKDHDVDEEVYGDWRMVQGIATPMNVTRYKNGDMAEETFYKKVDFNPPYEASLFDQESLRMKK